jgi:hypothetical protein
MDLPEFKIFKHSDRSCWFIAEAFSGPIVINGCRSLDAAIQARQRLIAMVRGLQKRGPDVALNLALGLRRIGWE